MNKSLTVNELWTLQQLANGILPRQMSSQAGVHIYTTNDRRKSIYKKLGVHTIEHAVAEGIRKGLIK